MITRGYKQTATYWGSPTPNGSGGFSYAAPVTLNVRWEDKAVQYSDPSGEINVSKSEVFVPSDVEIGGYLYLGTSVNADPTAVAGAYEIKQVHKIPDLRNARAERRAFL